jgi:LPPG:FO 2-phospho-L-lactate transferase
MSDDVVSTIIHTPETSLAFQDYFVRRQQVDTVTGVSFAGIDSGSMSAEALAAIDEAGVIVFCPSNPLVSIGPILALPGVRDRVREAPGVRIGVSPIVGGKAIKGPADRMLQSLGHESSAYGVARMYEDVLDVFIIDVRDVSDRERIEALGMRVVVTDAVMGDRSDRARLAGDVLNAAELAREAVS